MLVVALVLATAAVALVLSDPQRLDSSRTRSAEPGWASGSASEPARGPGGRRRRWRRPAWVVAAALATWVASSAVEGTDLGVALVASVSALAGVRAFAAGRRAEEARRRRGAVVDFCEALVGELRAGQPVLVSLERSAAVWPEVAPAVAAARLGADLPGALRWLARSPGAEALQHLAAAWQLCEATGGGLTLAAQQVLEATRADAAALRQVEGEVSSARATARLVAALPVVVLVAGDGLGARPWAFLFGNPAGVTCLGAGVLLVVLGLAWIDRIAASATSSDA